MPLSSDSPTADLRALDCRFLLPGSNALPGVPWRQLTMLGGPAGVAARAMAAGLADKVTALPASERSDAVVAYADAPQAIHEIAACVAPNGVPGASR